MQCITRCRPVGIKIVDDCRVGVQEVWGGGDGVAGDPYTMSPGGGGGWCCADGPVWGVGVPGCTQGLSS